MNVDREGWRQMMESRIVVARSLDLFECDREIGRGPNAVILIV